MQIVCCDFPSGKSKIPIYMCALSCGRLVTEIPAVDLKPRFDISRQLGERLKRPPPAPAPRVSIGGVDWGPLTQSTGARTGTPKLWLFL
jgi:hypothetical protein